MHRLLSISMLLILLGLPATVHCTEEPISYNFMRIDVNQGLSHNQVYSIFRDSRGFMWFGTNFGLNRFDGYSFRVLRHIPSDSTSLSDNRIRNLFEGPEGNLWISQLDGYIIYDPVKEIFTHDHPLFHKNIEIPYTDLSGIHKDHLGNIWFISDEDGIFLYRESSEKIQHFPFGNSEHELSRQQITAVCSSSDDKAWFIGSNGILELMNLDEGKVIFRTDFLNRYFPEWGMLQFFLDRDGELWIYSAVNDEGVILFSPKNNDYQHFHTKSSKLKLSSNIVNSIVDDEEGRIWLGTDHGGINIIDKKDFSIRVLKNDPEDERSLSHNSITALYRDNEGIIWAGTYKKGVCYYHKHLYKFKLYRHRQNDPNSLPFDDVNCFSEDEKGNLWIGTNGDGLCYFDRANNSFKVYKNDPMNSSSLSNDVIVSMLYDSNSQLWLGTFYGGLNRFDGQKFYHYRSNPKDSGSLAGDNVWEIYEDVLGTIWIGTLGNGIDRYDPDSDRFIHYRSGMPNALHSNFILHITGDERGNLWIGTADGLEYYDREKNNFVQYVHNPADTNSISNDIVSCIILDSRGLLWLATQEGLNIMEPGSDNFRRFYLEDGLPDNTILSVIEDDSGNIWASTTNGIVQVKILNYRDIDNMDIEFISFNEEDGLQGKEFNEDVAFKTTRGEIIFGGPDGFNLFKPTELTYNTNQPEVVITEIQVLNKVVEIGQEINGRILLTQALSATKEIVLKHTEDIFSIEFSALNYIHPGKNKFEYKLEGFNRDWIPTDASERKATYTNLDPGDYLFRVRASNNDGVWNEEGVAIRIRVRPPLWKTKGAIAFYFALLVAAMFLLRHLILQRERLKFRNEQEKQEAQRRHELDLMKIRFFTNVSHEFRTPLSLIITPLERMMKNPREEDQKTHLKLIYRNARRLLNLVNQLLDFRRMEVQKIDLKTAYGDIISFINEIYKSFTDLAEKKSIKFTYNSTHQEFFTFFDHDKLEKIIFNLLSNAFKFTPENRSIRIDIEIQDENKNLFKGNKVNDSVGWINIKVEDTGLGIPKENLGRIFDRFFQDDDTGNVINQGSGIGLSLTRDFVELHEGTIEVQSEHHKGTCFMVQLPLLSKATDTKATISEIVTEPGLPVAEEYNGETTQGKKPASILLVEDNDDFRFYLKDNLKAAYTIFEASNGREGLEKAKLNLPDLVVSDVMMPEMDGFELCRILKSSQDTSHIPVILLTARMSQQKKLEGFETGADDYITKPFSFELLESRISNLIYQRQRMKDSFQKHFKIEPGEIKITSLDEKLIKRALELVESNMSNPEFSVERLSRELGMSRVHLYKKLTALTGKTPIEFIRIMRLKRAAQLLDKSQLTIAEVAYEVGFNDPRYFSKYFKTEFGMLPSQYINSRKEKT